MERSPLITYPIWNGRNFIVNKNLCFVVMPFNQEWSDIVFSYIKEILSKSNLDVKRADSVSGHIIMEDIWRLLNEAMIVIVDISFTNPNVFYELGIAHTLGKNIVLLTQSTEHIPFDISPYRHIIYKNDASAYKTLNAKLPHFIDHILKESPTGDIFIDSLIKKMKIWEESSYDYEYLISVGKLHTIKLYSDVDRLPDKLLTYCLLSAIYHGDFENVPFWLELNRHSLYTGELLGKYIIMPYRRVRYRAAYILQFMDESPKQKAIEIIKKDGSKDKLVSVIENGQVKEFISTNMGNLTELPKNYGEQLLGEFEWIEQKIKEKEK